MQDLNTWMTPIESPRFGRFKYCRAWWGLVFPPTRGLRAGAEPYREPQRISLVQPWSLRVQYLIPRVLWLLKGILREISRLFFARRLPALRIVPTLYEFLTCKRFCVAVLCFAQTRASEGRDDGCEARESQKEDRPFSVVPQLQENVSWFARRRGR